MTSTEVCQVGERSDCPDDPPVANLALMVTRRCNMSCGHCSVESGPGVKEQPPEGDLLRYVRDAAAAGVQSLLFTGGEPMLREKVVLRLLRECRRLGLASVITTNGFWGKTARGARRGLRALRRAGLDAMTVSYDRYHAEFQGPQPALNIGRAAQELRFPINVNITRAADESELDEIVSAFEGLDNVRLRFYDVQPVGRARQLPQAGLRAEVAGFCSSCSFPAVTSDGRLTACNGPSFFAKADSPLCVGSLREAPLAELLARHRQDPVLETIRAFGPAGLRDELVQISGFESFPFRPQYQGMCELCHHITSNPEAVRALRSRLAEPRLAAQRLVVRKVINGSRRGGSLDRDYVNGIGACRVLLAAMKASGDGWISEAERFLGRADLDWRRLAQYVSECGLARPLLPVVDDPRFARWAPRFFGKQIQASGVRDALREPLARQALGLVSRALLEVDTQGVLLNAGALFALEAEANDPAPTRRLDQIEVCVEPSLAPQVRGRLVELGFRSEDRDARRGPAALHWQGLPLLIQTRIMPSPWTLPEREMLASARPLEGAGRGRLATLDADGLLLHATLRVSARHFSHGLQTAWDLGWVLRRFPEIRWPRLAEWVAASRPARGFWAPAGVLSRELGLPLPSQFLNLAPRDARQGKLEKNARKRLFNSLQGPLDLHPFKRGVAHFRLHGSWLGAVHELLSPAHP